MLKIRVRAFLHVHRLKYWKAKRDLRHGIYKALGGIMPCKDCYRETYPKEMYRLNPETWKEANRVDKTGWQGSGFLCIKCVEKRLGRRLTEADFSDGPRFNRSMTDSKRLISRRGW